MRKTIKHIFWGIFVFSSFLACTPKIVAPAPAPIIPEVVEPVVDTKANTIAQIQAQDLVFSTLSLRGKATLDLDGSPNNVNMQMRMKKGERIWISITAIAGIEVARALITPDSIFVRNNLDKSYLKQPLTFLNQYTNKQVNFAWIEALFTGNLMPGLIQPEVELNQNQGLWQAKGSQAGLMYQYQFNDQLKTKTLSLNDILAAQALEVNYTEYAPLNTGIFPYAQQLKTLSGQKKIGLQVNFSKVDYNPNLEFPFSIPKNYSQIQ